MVAFNVEGVVVALVAVEVAVVEAAGVLVGTGEAVAVVEVAVVEVVAIVVVVPPPRVSRRCHHGLDQSLLRTRYPFSLTATQELVPVFLNRVLLVLADSIAWKLEMSCTGPIAKVG
jgi:hypothetical protein